MQRVSSNCWKNSRRNIQLHNQTQDVDQPVDRQSGGLEAAGAEPAILTIFKESKMKNIYIQYQGIMGDWVTCNTISDNESDTGIKIALQNMKLSMPNSRVIAIHEDGYILDIWP